MAFLETFAWFAVGAGLLLGILVITAKLNMRRTTAHLALQLAEAYRSRGMFDAALRLYEVPAEAGQKLEEVPEGRRLAEQRKARPPAIEPALLEAGVRLLEDDLRAAQAILDRRGVAVELVPLEPEAVR